MQPILSNSKGRNPEQGAAIMLLVLLSIPIISLLALAVDGFLLRSARIQQESSAEYAAMAALRLQRSGATVATATSEAERVAGLNLYIATGGASVGNTDLMMTNPSGVPTSANNRAGSIYFGTFDPATGAFTQVADCIGGCNAVQVILWTKDQRWYKTFFAKAIGVPQVKIASRATAYFDASKVNQSTAPYFLVNCAAVGA